jgi:hypothetical protein
MVMISSALLAELEPVRRGGLRKRRAGAWIERAAIRGLPRALAATMAPAPWPSEPSVATQKSGLLAIGM